MRVGSNAATPTAVIASYGGAMCPKGAREGKGRGASGGVLCCREVRVTVRVSVSPRLALSLLRIVTLT